MASALVVVMVTIATYGALDAASKASGRSKARSIAASLAQQDQERLRGMRASDLASFDTSTPVNVDGVTYTVRSQGTYTSDAYDGNGCTATGRVDFVKIVSTVTWPAIGGSKPVRVESLVHPPPGTLGAGQGALGIQIRNAAGGPVAGLMINVSGTASFSQATDSNGCAFFPYVPAGPYTVSYAAGGWVDPGGTTNISFPATVSSEHLSSYQKDYDQKGRIRATLESRWSSAIQAVTTVPLKVTHNGPPMISKAATAGSMLVVDNLFPFTSPYNVYAGECAANVLPGTLVSQLPANTYQQIDTVTPGDNDFSVFVPAFQVRVYRKNSSGSNVAMNSSSVTVKATPTDSGCATAYTINGTTDANAYLRFPVPYGNYSLCVSGSVNGSVRRYTLSTSRVNNQYNPTNINMQSIPWTGSTGTCP